MKSGSSKQCLKFDLMVVSNLIVVIYLYLFTEIPTVDFGGINSSFLDASDVKKINALSLEEKFF